MSFCRITGRARNLPKSNYFPMTTTYTAASLRRFCRITGKSYGLPTHHFLPIVLKKKIKKAKNGTTFSLGGTRDPNYGQKKHKIVSSQRYVCLDFNSADDLRGILDDILDEFDVAPEERDKRYVYKIAEHKFNIIIDARMEAAIRSGVIEDIMFAKDGETLVLKTRSGQLIPLDLMVVKGRAIGELFEGEGVEEIETLEMELNRVTEHLRRFSLFDRIAESVLDAFPEMKAVGISEKKMQKQLRTILKQEELSNMLVNFIDGCVEKILLGAEKHGKPIKGVNKKQHRDTKILKILTMIFDNPKEEVVAMQQLMLEQEAGENVLDRVNGTVARYTPGTIDYIIANANTCDPNEIVMNILQLGIQTFLKEVSMNNPVNGDKKFSFTPSQLEYYQEFLEQTSGLMNCLTRSCGEIECYGSDVHTIIADFIHANAARCNFETPLREMVKEIGVRTRIPLFYTHDEAVLELYLLKHKKKCRDSVLIVKDGIKCIVPKSMLKYLADKSAGIVLLDEEGIQFVLDCIKDEDDFFLEGNEEGVIDPKEYVSKRPRRQSSSDKSLVKGDRRGSILKNLKRKKRINHAANPHWKNVYKKYQLINNTIYMFRAYTHENKSKKIY